MAFTLITQGYFVQPATAVGMNIPLPSGADYFKTYNLTKMAAAAPTGCIMGEWFGGGVTAVNDGLRWRKAGSAATLVDSFSTSTASNGFTYYRTYPEPQAALTGTTITQANGAVATVTNTYSEGDQVIIYNAVGMEQISGMTFTISSVSGSGFTLTGLDSSGFAAAATAFSVRRIAPAPRVAPPFLYVTKVTQATPGVVTVSQKHQYVVGQAIEFTVPGSFGMVQLNNYYQGQSKPVIITAVTDYTMTLNIDTSNYTAFAFPTSASSPTSQLFATLAPAGQSTQFNPITGVQTGYNFNYVPFHSGLFVPYMYLPAGAQSPAGEASDKILWQAYKMETGTINSPIPS